jgi:hypothetical protein
VDDLAAKRDAPVANHDVQGRAGDELPDLILALAAEGAAVVSH